MPTSAGIFSKLGRNNGGHFSRTFRGNMVLTVPSVFTFVFQNWSDNFVNAALGNRESKPGESKPRWWALACTKGIQKLKQWVSGWQLKSSHIEPWSFHSDHLTELHKKAHNPVKAKILPEHQYWTSDKSFLWTWDSSHKPKCSCTSLLCIYVCTHFQQNYFSEGEIRGEKWEGNGRKERKKETLFQETRGLSGCDFSPISRIPIPTWAFGKPFWIIWLGLGFSGIALVVNLNENLAYPLRALGRGWI